MTPETQLIVTNLLIKAGLPPVVDARPLMGRGFDSEISVLTLEDGRRTVLRMRRQGTPVGQERERFLDSLDLPSPHVLAMDGQMALHEFIEGQTIGDAIEAGGMSDRKWRHVGEAFRRIHAVTFPHGLGGPIEPMSIDLQMRDPVVEMHEFIAEILPKLGRFGREIEGAFAGLHQDAERLAERLRRAPVSLLHGDVNMWNMLVDDDRAVAIDWDYPRVGLSWREVSLLDKHAWLFNGTGLPEAFFAGYGEVDRDVLAFHRVLETTEWAVNDEDWEDFSREAPDLRDRAASWHRKLTAYAIDLPRHVAALRDGSEL